MKKIVLKSLQLQAEMRILHWQTMSYTEHMAFNGFYDEADDIVDRLIEAIQGKYGRIMLGGIDSIQVSDYNNLKINMFLIDMTNFFQNEIWTCGLDRQNDTEISNVIDEMKAQIDKLKYLLTLK